MWLLSTLPSCHLCVCVLRFSFIPLAASDRQPRGERPWSIDTVVTSFTFLRVVTWVQRCTLYSRALRRAVRVQRIVWASRDWLHRTGHASDPVRGLCSLVSHPPCLVRMRVCPKSCILLSFHTTSYFWLVCSSPFTLPHTSISLISWSHSRVYESFTLAVISRPPPSPSPFIHYLIYVLLLLSYTTSYMYLLGISWSHDHSRVCTSIHSHDHGRVCTSIHSTCVLVRGVVMLHVCEYLLLSHLRPRVLCLMPLPPSSHRVMPIPPSPHTRMQVIIPLSCNLRPWVALRCCRFPTVSFPWWDVLKICTEFVDTTYLRVLDTNLLTSWARVYQSTHVPDGSIERIVRIASIPAANVLSL